MIKHLRAYAAGALLVPLLLSGCAPATTDGGTRTRQDRITQEELAEVQVSTLYEAVQRLRPRWIQVRSQQSFGTPTEIVVYQNQTQLGGVDILRQLGLESAEWLQYLDGPTAMATLPGLGTRQIEGAIVIHTRR